MASKLVEVWVPITELHYVDWAKIKTNSYRQQNQTDDITHYLPSLVNMMCT